MQYEPEVATTDPDSAFQLWSDNESDIDLLGFEYIADEIAELVTSRAVLPITVGVFGDWGSGKSTILMISMQRLAELDDVVVVPFNGWLFEGYDDAKSALVGSILESIESRIDSVDTGKLEKARALFKKLLSRIDLMRTARFSAKYLIPVATGVPALALPSLAGDLASLGHKAFSRADEIADDAQGVLKAEQAQRERLNDIRQFRSDFQELVQITNIRSLVVIIDDLDRCLPETVIETLEAIKLFLFVERSAFVIGADERLIQYSVRQRFPELPGTETETGRDYLEKLIQVPIRIPPLSTSLTESYMNSLWAQKRLSPEEFGTLHRYVITEEDQQHIWDPISIDTVSAALPGTQTLGLLQDDFELTTQIVPVLVPGLQGNPRRAKRFLNSLMLRLSLARKRHLNLQRRVLAKLMLLEYLRPESFRQLAKLQAEEAGRPSILSETRSHLSSEEYLMGQETLTDSTTKATASILPASKSEKVSKGVSNKSEDVRAVSPSSLSSVSETWLADQWLRDWLGSDPDISGVDLGPYFYIAHDSLAFSHIAGPRVSPRVRSVLNRLLSSEGPSQQAGLAEVAKFDQQDVVAVFDVLANRIRVAENLMEEPSFSVIFRFVESRRELVSQLIALFSSITPSKIPVSTPMSFANIIQGFEGTAEIIELLQAWSRGGSGPLKTAAALALQRIGE